MIALRANKQNEWGIAGFKFQTSLNFAVNLGEKLYDYRQFLFLKRQFKNGRGTLAKNQTFI